MHRIVTIVSAGLLLTLCGCGGSFFSPPRTLHEQAQPSARVQSTCDESAGDCSVSAPRQRPPDRTPPSRADLAYDDCSTGVLDQGAPLGQVGPDLVISNMTCTVDGTKAPYNFHNVYILGTGNQTGTLAFSNATMHFYAANILVQSQGVLQATGIGADNGGQVLTIHLYGSSTDPGVVCQKLDGTNLVADPTCGVPADVWASNQMTMDYPTSCTKASQLSPPTLLPGNVDDCFYQYMKLDGTDNNAYFGHKVLAVSYNGTVNFSGFKGAQGGNDSDPSVTGSSWMRLNATLRGGGTETSMQVSGAPADWTANDKIVVTATDYLPGHAEQLQVASVSGSTVTLSASTPVQNPHWGQTYSLSTVPCNAPAGTTDCQIGPALLTPSQDPATRSLDMRAAVGLLSRSIRVVSDGAQAGTALPTSGVEGYFGGHSLARQGFLSYQVQGVEFYQMGQGGAIGHYPVHFHMARKVPTGTYVKDSAVWDSMTRFMTIHSTQGVTLARNVGYKSIGHGFYLEDGTETDNVLNTNLGVFVRAAVQNAQNDRLVPGILAAPGNGTDPGQPIHSDWQNPTVFWIMNGWNDFQYNFASSAGTCGVCYWDLPGGISGPSRKEYFESYAGQQITNQGYAGFTPLKKFVGNSCSVAMSSFLDIGTTGSCLGVTNNGASEWLQAVPNPAAPPQGDPSINDPNYPYVTGLAKPTLCPDGVCPTFPCGASDPPQLENCYVTTLERYTTSFNWAAKNFSAIWMRRWWFLVENSAITDVQQGGITFVTGGGYTRSELAQGYWSLMRTSALVGNTQKTDGKPTNAYAWSAGPFNPSGLQCDNPRTDFCLSAAQGIVYPIDSFSGNQRLINIYDGPSHQERNAFMDIPTTPLGPVSMCSPNGTEQYCPAFGYLYGNRGEFGLPRDANGTCYLPNAAIAWKQSNGFYYPPAFHSDQLYFQNVDIRHFVIEPLLNYGTFTTDQNRVTGRYCNWPGSLFNNFTDIDRQTVLNDDDGSLTGLLADLGSGQTRETISVNRPVAEAGFFNDPKVTVECATDVHALGSPATAPPGTANTSPNEYITTGIIAGCGINRGGCRQGGFNPPSGDCSINPRGNQYCAWGDDCGQGVGPKYCYGVPLYRQYLTTQEFTQYSRNPSGYNRPTVRAMGEGNGQRSTLTVNHGLYYIDDQVSMATQKAAGATEWNIFFPNEIYYVYFVYAKPSLNQTYTMFVGYGLNKQTVESSVQPYRAKFPSDNFQFSSASGASFLNVSYDDRLQSSGGTGLVTVQVHLDGYSGEFESDRPQFCQPASYCAPSGNACKCAPGSSCTDDSVCAWAIKDMDCPLNGCFAFGITMPGTFQTGVATTPPVPLKFTDDPQYTQNWDTAYQLVDQTITGAQCHYSAPPQ